MSKGLWECYHEEGKWLEVSHITNMFNPNSSIMHMPGLGKPFWRGGKHHNASKRKISMYLNALLMLKE